MKANLTGGVLGDLRQKIVHAILYKVSPQDHAATYAGDQGNLGGLGSDMYAEPEFSGKYLDICTQLYRSTGDETALNHAKTVFESILAHQRPDGYLGCLPEGKEFINFGVWNQLFTILGLVSYYKLTRDDRAVQAALKSANYTMPPFMDGRQDIFDTLNDGSQHIGILLPLCQLYEVTGDEKVKGYILWLVEKIRHSNLNFLDFEDILEIRSRKGIENFVILLGILEYGRLFQDAHAVASVEKYWQQLHDTQIRNTGNGTLVEFWTPGGGGAMHVSAEQKPNETCVAVGWIELSLKLFYLTQDAKYLTALDKTLYNHILASPAEDGSDFAYYQPNFGRKVRTTAQGFYKCCRYRGFTLFSYMDEMLWYEDARTLIPMIYTSNSYESEDVSAVMQTNYPYEPEISLHITTRQAKLLKLRLPEHCTLAGLNASIKDDYAEILLQPGETALTLRFESQLFFEQGEIDGQLHTAVHFGPLLLAAEQPGDVKLDPKAEFIPLPSDGERKIRFQTGKLSFCEYSAADDYYVWIPSSKI